MSPADSPLHRATAGMEPDACAAIRLGRAHRRGDQVLSLLECEICGQLPGASLCTPSLVGGEVIGTVLIQREGGIEDADERRVLESVNQAAPVLANLRNLSLAEARALTDTLTGLPNKRAIEDTLKRMAAHSSRSGNPLAAIMFDLDHFKQINDRTATTAATRCSRKSARSSAPACARATSPAGTAARSS